MSTKEVALVLGGTVPHVELIRQLRGRGYYVILIDYLDDSPAKRFADEHIQESTLDQEAVLKVAINRNAALVISSAIDQANIICCYVAEKLDLPHPYSYEMALNATHKDRMKRIMVEGGVSTAPFVDAEDVKGLEEAGIGFPCVVKPTNSSGSKGVRVARNAEELERYLPLAKEASSTNDAIIESFVSGLEVSSYFYVQDGVAYSLATCQKSNYTRCSRDVVRQYESVIYPAEISKDANDTLTAAANKIARALDLKNTPLFVQAIIEESGNAYVLEFALRLGGGLCFRSIPLLTGFNFINASICSYLGETIDICADTVTSKKLLIGNMFAKAGHFDHVEGVEEAVAGGLIREFYNIKTKGAEIGADGSSGSRFGQFISLGRNRDELFRKEEAARTIIKAFDVNGLMISV